MTHFERTWGPKGLHGEFLTGLPVDFPDARWFPLRMEVRRHLTGDQERSETRGFT